LPKFPAPLRAIPAAGWKWLLAACVLMAAQSLVFVVSIAWFQQATAANVMYSSRGLWSVVAVWLIGHWFHNQEQKLGASVLAWRLVGASLMVAAIALVRW
jgi:hypothetical protein